MLNDAARKKTSTAVKLIQAAALAAVLVPLGSVAVETSTCTFGSGSGPVSPCNQGVEGGLLFDFGVGGSAPYKVELVFDDINGQFDVTINDVATNYNDITERFTESFAGYQPLPIGTDPTKPYIDFQIIAPPPGADTWTSDGPRGVDATIGYNLFIYWLADTNALFPSPVMLHDTGPLTDPEHDPQFDLDMTQSFFPNGICGVFDPCIGFEKIAGDPAVGGRDDQFSGVTLADPNGTAPIPEPTTLVLLGSGIGGMLYRRRQRRQNAETPPSL